MPTPGLRYDQLRGHFTSIQSGSRPKVPFDTKARAEESIRERGHTDTEAYLCPTCKKWHIGGTGNGSKNWATEVPRKRRKKHR
jgi:hypothetical protein